MLDLSVNLWYVLYKNERGPFKMTIPELLRKTYEFDFECNRFLDSSYNRKLYTVGIFEKSNLANIPIEEITKDDLNRFLASITNYSNSTIAKIYVCLKESFVLAKLDGIIDENPFDNIRAFRLPKSNKPDKKVSAFTVDEEKAFLNALNDEYTRPTHGNWYRHQFLIALHTGMRMGEINGLKPEDIDLDKKLIYVRRTVARGKNYQVVVHDKPKTRAGERTIPINKAVLPVLEDALKRYRKNKDGLLFYDFKMKRPISTSIVNNAFCRICDKAGIPHRGQHGLRHTFATRSIEAGVPAPVLAKWLGHTDVSITLNTYTDVFNRMQNENMLKYEEYMDLLAEEVEQK